MSYNHELVVQKLRAWEGGLRDYSLPSWEELPAIELYMDQVISLLAEYLKFLPLEDGDDTVVTAAAINNYVRKKIMPPPVKKRYRKIHLAYLVILCSLKQCVSISYIQRMIPLGMSEEEMRRVYNQFVCRHHSVCQYFIQQVNAVASELFAAADGPESGARNLVTSAAVISGLTRMMAERILLLQEQDADPQKEKPSSSREKAQKEPSGRGDSGPQLIPLNNEKPVSEQQVG